MTKRTNSIPAAQADIVKPTHNTPYFWDDESEPDDWQGLVSTILDQEQVKEFQDYILDRYTKEVSLELKKLIEDIPEDKAVSIMDLFPEALKLAKTANKSIGKHIRKAVVSFFPNADAMTQQAVCMMCAATWQQYKASIDKATEFALYSYMND